LLGAIIDNIIFLINYRVTQITGF